MVYVGFRDNDEEHSKKLEFLKKYDKDVFSDSISDIQKHCIDYKFQKVLKRKDLNKIAKKKIKQLNSRSKLKKERKELKQLARDVYDLPNVKRTALNWMLDGDVDAKDICAYVKKGMKLKKLTNRNKTGWLKMKPFTKENTVLMFKEHLRDLRSDNWQRKQLEKEGLFGIMEMANRKPKLERVLR